MDADGEGPTRLSRAEFEEELASLIDMDVEELRAKTEAMEWEPPWEAARRQFDE